MDKVPVAGGDFWNESVVFQDEDRSSRTLAKKNVPLWLDPISGQDVPVAYEAGTIMEANVPRLILERIWNSAADNGRKWLLADGAIG